VTLGWDVAAALPGLRAEAESLMTDTVLIRRKSGAPVLNQSTGELVQGYTTIYSGVCRLKMRSTVVRDVDAASQLLGVQSPELHVPVAGTADIRNDDVFELTASVGDPGLVGLSGVVVGMFPHTGSTARRLPVEVAS
jgi:hypothetical protein